MASFFLYVNTVLNRWKRGYGLSQLKGFFDTILGDILTLSMGGTFYKIVAINIYVDEKWQMISPVLLLFVAGTTHYSWHEIHIRE